MLYTSELFLNFDVQMLFCQNLKIIFWKVELLDQLNNIFTNLMQPVILLGDILHHFHMVTPLCLHENINKQIIFLKCMDVNYRNTQLKIKQTESIFQKIIIL